MRAGDAFVSISNSSAFFFFLFFIKVRIKTCVGRQMSLSQCVGVQPVSHIAVMMNFNPFYMVLFYNLTHTPAV